MDRKISNTKPRPADLVFCHNRSRVNLPLNLSFNSLVRYNLLCLCEVEVAISNLCR